MSKLSRSEILAGDEIEVVIDDLGLRGQGTVVLEDGLLLVPGTLPGERVRVRVREDQNEEAEHLFADVVEILEPSENRRDPLCERDDVCRGCQLRHLTIAAELEYKVETVREAIEDQTGIATKDQPEIDVVTPQPIARGDAFRIRTRLKYRRRQKGFELGLTTPVRPELVPMHDCPALTEPVRRLVTTIRKTLERCGELLPDDRGRDEKAPLGLVEIGVVSPTYGVGLIDVRLSETEDRDRFEARILERPISSWLEELAGEVPEKVGVAISSGEYREEVVEPTRIRIPVGRWNMQVGYDDWFHSTLKPADRVYQQMMKWLDFEETDRVLDIGCATGTITLMTSEHVQEVVGVDVNASSIEAAEINAVAHRRDNVRFVVAGWERALRELAMDDETFTVATIHPTDEPLGRRVLAFLEILKVGRLVYLGPSPEAAARDLEALKSLGWSLTNLGAGNLDPASFQTLLMAAMKRDVGCGGTDEKKLRSEQSAR